MSKEKIVENPKLEEFKSRLRGWVTSPDGEDFCPKSWAEYLKKRRAEDDPSGKILEMVKSDSKSTSKLAETRKAFDGWFVMCAEENCREEVFIPF